MLSEIPYTVERLSRAIIVCRLHPCDEAESAAEFGCFIYSHKYYGRTYCLFAGGFDDTLAFAHSLENVRHIGPVLNPRATLEAYKTSKGYK